ncbi:hypothetical protein B566_EDAN013074, partial [Ephemera danica]
WFGIGCLSSCGHCRNHEPCDHVTGRCTNGCADGWLGPECSKGCTAGKYGINCSSQCSVNCKNQKCNHVTGACTDGCADGWHGTNCLGKMSESNGNFNAFFHYTNMTTMDKRCIYLFAKQIEASTTSFSLNNYNVEKKTMENNATKCAAKTAVVMELVIDTQVTALMDAFRIGLE